MEELNLDEIEAKNSKLDDLEGGSDVSEDDEEDEEETPREQRLIIRKKVNELMSKRIPGETYLQDGPCFQMSHEGTMMCHECKFMPIHEKRNILSMENNWDNSEISCCFYSFRKLKVSKNGGSLSNAGFLGKYIYFGQF